MKKTVKIAIVSVVGFAIGTLIAIIIDYMRGCITGMNCSCGRCYDED